MLAESLDAFLGADELAAVKLMRDQFHVDVTRTYQFWESAVAIITTGTKTAVQCPWDVELPYGDTTIRIEVKFSQEFTCRFRNGSRPVLKFADPKGSAAVKDADVIVLIGIDGLDDVYAWAIPAGALPKMSSITITSPRARLGTGTGHRSPVEGYQCPPTQLLPEILRAWRCHLHYDREHHAQTAARTRAALATAGMEPMFEVAG